MPLSYQQFTATGSESGIFNFTLPFLDSDHLQISKNGTVLTTGVEKSVTGSYPYTGAAITITPNPINGDLILIKRITPVTSSYLWKDFSDASILKANDLDDIQRYLVFLVQEADDTANSTVMETFDGQLTTKNIDGVARRIEDIVSPIKTNDAASKAYVDSIALYGGAAASIEPQLWEKVGSDFTGTDAGGGNQTGDCTYDLESPSPLGDSENLFVVSVNGVIKTPLTDFTVAAGTFTLKMGSGTLAATDKVVIRNFGVMRNYLSQPIQPDSANLVAFMVRGVVGQTSDLQQWQSYDGTVLSKVDNAGNATFPTVSSGGRITGNELVSSTTLNVTGDATLSANASVAGTLQVDGNVTLNPTTLDENSPETTVVNGALSALNGLTATNGAINLGLGSYSTIQNVWTQPQVYDSSNADHSKWSGGRHVAYGERYVQSVTPLTITPSYGDSLILMGYDLSLASESRDVGGTYVGRKIKTYVRISSTPYFDLDYQDRVGSGIDIYNLQAMNQFDPRMGNVNDLAADEAVLTASCIGPLPYSLTAGNTYKFTVDALPYYASVNPPGSPGDATYEAYMNDEANKNNGIGVAHSYGTPSSIQTVGMMWAMELK